jgi:hypothetical protein
MRKNTFLVSLFAILFFAAHAQKLEKTASGSEQANYVGYLIRVMHVNNIGFGYNIYYRSKMVVSQRINPFTLSPLGMKNKEDALKIAKWQVRQLMRERKPITIMNKLISKDVATQLKISTT